MTRHWRPRPVQRCHCTRVVRAPLHRPGRARNTRPASGTPDTVGRLAATGARCLWATPAAELIAASSVPATTAQRSGSSRRYRMTYQLSGDGADGR